MKFKSMKGVNIMYPWNNSKIKTWWDVQDENS